MPIHNVFHSVLPIFFIAFLGSIIKRKWLTSNEFWRGLEKLSFYLLFPAVLFEHTSKVDITSSEFYKLTLALITSITLVIIILVIYQFRKNHDNQQFTSIFQGSTRYNNYIFFALSAALFGDEGLSIVAFISPYMIIFTNIISIIAFAYYIPQISPDSSNSKTGGYIILKSIFTNPFIIASIVGFIFNYLQIQLNIGVEKTIQSIADSALPIGIMIIGATLKVKISTDHFKQVLFASSLKLIVLPGITFIILWLMSVTGMARSVGILFSCLPCASSAYILSRQLGGDPETMSAIITFTTIFSILSLSMLVYILG